MEPDANGVVLSSNFPLSVWVSKRAGPELSDASLDRLNRDVLVISGSSLQVLTGSWRLLL